VIQIIVGILGGHAAATAAKEHSFGAIGHTIVGALGGGLSGYFLQTFAGMVVTAGGSLDEPTAGWATTIRWLRDFGAWRASAKLKRRRQSGTTSRDPRRSMTTRGITLSFAFLGVPARKLCLST